MTVSREHGGAGPHRLREGADDHRGRRARPATTSCTSPRTSPSPAWPTTRRPRRCARRSSAAHRPTVTTVVVERLVRSTALLEVELHASKGGGTELLRRQRGARGRQLDLVAGARGPRRHGPPADHGADRRAGRRRAPRRLRRPVRLLPGAGRRAAARGGAVARQRGHHLRLLHAGDPGASTAKTHQVRKELLGGAGVYPGRGRHPDEPAAPPRAAGRDRRDRLAAPAGAGQPRLAALRHPHLLARASRPAGRCSCPGSRRWTWRPSRRCTRATSRPRPRRRTARSCSCCATPGSGRRTCCRPSSSASSRRCRTTARSPPVRERLRQPALAGLDRWRSARGCCGRSSCWRSSRPRCYPEEAA